MNHETLQQGIARVASAPHTPVAQLVERYYLDPKSLNHFGSFTWSGREPYPLSVQGDLVQYIGFPQQLIPESNWRLESGNKLMVLSVERMAISRTDDTERLRSVMKEAVWKIGDTNADYVVAASWDKYIDALVSVAPGFFVAGLIDDNYVKVKIAQMIQHTAARQVPYLQDVFPVVAADSVSLYKSITGEPYPDMSD